MNITESLRGAWRRVRGGMSAADENAKRRRTAPLPSILNTYSPRADALPKATPQNLRRFAETPVARKAINTVKDRIAGMRWRVQEKSSALPRTAGPSLAPRALAQDDTLKVANAGALARDDTSMGVALQGRNAGPSTRAEAALARDDTSIGANAAGPVPAERTPALQATSQRIHIVTANLERPNADDSFRSFAEQVLEDVMVGGFGAAEVQLTGEAARPLALWPVDGATIRMRADWDGRPESPRYVQVTGRAGPEGQIALNDEELMYIRLNPRTHTPFGLGRLEVAFETINEFLGAHRYAARLASNSVVQYALWLKDLSPAHHERLIRWWQDEIEGTGRVPILSVESRPEVLRFGGGTDTDLRLEWQEFLLRVIACAFDLPPMFLGVERDVNRSTADELGDMAFRSAIVPTARLLAEHLTRDVLAKRLGWDDLEFVFCELESRNELQEAQIQEILLRNGVVTVEEVRKMRGMG